MFVQIFFSKFASLLEFSGDASASDELATASNKERTCEGNQSVANINS